MPTIPWLFILLFNLISTFALFPAHIFGQSVRYDYRPGSQISELKTFAFREVGNPSAAAASTTVYDSPLTTERTRNAIVAQLKSRGITYNDAQPDMYVTMNRSYQKTYEVYGGYGGYAWNPYGYGWPPFYGYGWAGWGAWSAPYIEESIEGTLVINLEDGQTGKLLWRGVGTKHVHETSTPSRRTKRVNEEVADIFRKLPVSLMNVDERR